MLPHLAEVVVEKVHRVGEVIRIGARPRNAWGRCPKCRRDSERVHSRYRRRPADTAIGGNPVVIDLTVRRFFCDNTDCPAKTFAEQVPGVTITRCRRSPPRCR